MPDLAPNKFDLTQGDEYSGLTERHPTDPSETHLGGNHTEGDALSFAPRVLEYVIRRFAIRTVLDLGSGLGHTAQFFHSHGCEVVAVDGLAANVKGALYPTVQIDLARQPVVTRVDLVHCQEVLEHVEEKHLDNVLASLTAGRVILLTHAVPGQPGHHHVNCQPPEYWVNHLAARGCAVLAEDSRRVRKLAEADGAVYLAKTGLVFTNSRW